MAGGSGGIAFGKILPVGTGAEDPEDAVQHFTCMSPRSATTIRSPVGLRNQRLQNRPLLVLEIHAHPASACLREHSGPSYTVQAFMRLLLVLVRGQLFDNLNDVVREAARIGAERRLSASGILELCQVGLARILD